MFQINKKQKKYVVLIFEEEWREKKMRFVYTSLSNLFYACILEKIRTSKEVWGMMGTEAMKYEFIVRFCKCSER